MGEVHVDARGIPVCVKRKGALPEGKVSVRTCQARWHGGQSTYSSVVTIDGWSTCVWGALDGRSTVGGCASGARPEDEGSVTMSSSLQMSMCSDCHAIEPGSLA